MNLVLKYLPATIVAICLKKTNPSKQNIVSDTQREHFCPGKRINQPKYHPMLKKQTNKKAQPAPCPKPKVTPQT